MKSGLLIAAVIVVVGGLWMGFCPTAKVEEPICGCRIKCDCKKCLCSYNEEVNRCVIR